VSGRYENSHIGVSVETALDLNGDGTKDLVVGGAIGSLEGNLRGGAVLVFYGPLGTKETPVDDTSADAALFGGDRDDNGFVCGVGDLDGDAVDDIVIGHPGAGSTNTGLAYVVHGPVAGVVDLLLDTQAFVGDHAGEYLGLCAGPGDVNSDGAADLVLTASDVGAGSLPGYGSAYVFRGPAEQTSIADADQILSGSTDQEYVGFTVARLGDVNGDGTGDYALGNYQISSTSPDGVAQYIVTDYVAGTMHPRDVGVTVHDDTGSPWGSMTATEMGDLDADGYADVGFDSGSAGPGNELSIVHGAFGHEAKVDLSAAAATTMMSSTAGSHQLSYAAPLGDWNGDGIGAVAIGDSAFATDDALTRFDDCAAGSPACMYGAVYILALPIEPGVHDLALEADRVEGAYENGFLGGGTGPRGGSDLNADGFPDLAFGAWSAYTTAEESGAAYVLFGGGSP
jgi:hypothetical protein